MTGAGGGDGERRAAAARSYHSAQAEIISGGGYYSDDDFAPEHTRPVESANEDEGVGRAEEGAAAEGEVGDDLEGHRAGDFAYIHNEPHPAELDSAPRPPSPGAQARERAQELAQRAQAFAEEQSQTLGQQRAPPTLPSAPPLEETGAEAGAEEGASLKPTLAPTPTLASTERRQSGELFDHPAFRKAAAQWVQVHEEAEAEDDYGQLSGRVSHSSHAKPSQATPRHATPHHVKPSLAHRPLHHYPHYKPDSRLAHFHHTEPTATRGFS